MGWTTGVQFLAWAMMGLFLFATISRMALGPTQPPIQWIPWALTGVGGKAVKTQSWPLTSI